MCNGKFRAEYRPILHERTLDLRDGPRPRARVDIIIKEYLVTVVPIALITGAESFGVSLHLFAHRRSLAFTSHDRYFLIFIFIFIFNSAFLYRYKHDRYLRVRYTSKLFTTASELELWSTAQSIDTYQTIEAAFLSLTL